MSLYFKHLFFRDTLWTTQRNKARFIEFESLNDRRLSFELHAKESDDWHCYSVSKDFIRKTSQRTKPSYYQPVGQTGQAYKRSMRQKCQSYANVIYTETFTFTFSWKPYLSAYLVHTALFNGERFKKKKKQIRQYEDKREKNPFDCPHSSPVSNIFWLTF